MLNSRTTAVEIAQGPNANIIAFTAFGVPQPKGSARAFVPKGWTRAVVTSANPKNKGWQQVVAEAASRAMSERSWSLKTGPVLLFARFYLPRPKSLGKKIAPHVKKPDLDKLVRSLKDALKQVVWVDDSQVVGIQATKAYAGIDAVPCVKVSIEDSL